MSASVVIIGGFSTWPGHYRIMKEHLRNRYGIEAKVVPIAMGEWPRLIRRNGWVNLLRKLDQTVGEAVAESDKSQVVVIAHSLGGIVTRLYLAERDVLGFRANYSKRIESVLTLGTPHKRGLVHYLTVWKGLQDCLAQSKTDIPIFSIVGRVDYQRRSRITRRGAELRYRIHGSNGNELGDGVIPVDSAIYDPKRVQILDGVLHDFRIGHPWYGDPEIVDQWWGLLKNYV